MGEKTSNKMENLSLQTNPIDLLTRFTRFSDPGHDPGRDPDMGLVDDVELNLGLSLNGRFGVDKNSNNNNNNKLVRASSIATILPVVKDDDDMVLGSGQRVPGHGYSGLVRTNSLPVETEDQWRKRKELQSLRRLAAKRRRSEKQRSLTKGERDEYVAAMTRVGSSPGPVFRSDKWQSCGASDANCQGSSGSGGETSSLQERNNLPPVGLERGNSIKKHGKEIGSGSVEDMPCVFTQGDGPNGRVIEGILYKYGKGEQVKIMCVCHGSFLSPAEFVRHAGGTDFLHPLKHIVVKPSPSFS